MPASGTAAGSPADAPGDEPVLSVIIPAFNEAGTIGKVVGGVYEVVRGLGMSCEVVVVDDGSTDGTGNEAAAAGARLISHPYNIGNGAAVKSGIRNARGEHPGNDGRGRPAPSRGDSRHHPVARSL